MGKMDKLNVDRVRELCARIQEEQNPQKFLELIQELNRVLGEIEPATLDRSSDFHEKD